MKLFQQDRKTKEIHPKIEHHEHAHHEHAHHDDHHHEGHHYEEIKHDNYDDHGRPRAKTNISLLVEELTSGR